MSNQGAGEGERRKADHLRLALDEPVGHAGITTGLERLRLNARALPGHDLSEVSLATTFLGHRLRAPLMISCMTGGTSEAGPVNLALARAAADQGVALGLGSGRVLLEGGDPSSFQVRQVAPDALVLANLGAVQLPEVGSAGCAELIERTGADALVLHLNAVQEAVQPEGDTAFAGLGDAIGQTVAELDVPVVVKEVGFGLAPEDIDALVAAGVAGIDVAGAGGTNWATVEGMRDSTAGHLAAAFADWGWSTVESLLVAVERTPTDVAVVASGGLSDGVDAAKCLALGADIAAFGRGLLASAATGPNEASDAVAVLIEQLRIAVWATGHASATELGRVDIRRTD